MAQQMSPTEILDAFNANATERSVVVNNKTYGNGLFTFDMPKAGVPTYSILSFAGTLARTEGADVGTVTASPGWPFNILGISTLVDPAGLTRLSLDGYDLYSIELVKAYGAEMRDPYSAEDYASSVYTASIPSGVASSTTSGSVNFSLIVPISYTKDSVLGSYVATTPNGQATFNGVENPLTGPTIKSPLTTSGGSSVALTGTWSWEYYYLDAPKQRPLPVSALTKVHELYHTESNENLDAGGQPQSVLLTGRDYLRVMQRLIEDNTESANHVSNIQFLVDSSTPTLNETLQAYRMRIRTRYGRDLPNGFIYRDFTRKPWQPNNYGSLTAQLTLTNAFDAGSYANLVTLRECLYTPSGNVVNMGATG